MTDRASFFEDLSAEVEIPSEGTLSRVVYKNDRIRVVVFAFDTGQELSEHTAAVPAVIQVLRGRLELTLGSDEMTATPGAWVHMPAKLPHSLRATEPSVVVLTMLPGG
ncbi:MAG: cupin domain-containing protein [Acidimicrobiia bacterium]|nr:cupin domain-containing protein [Acidimicrobiia bacterium]